ncbi:HDOD domain-containing protein [Desulfovibrio inopinatus]|uniref:HDOD domain-containing protein n=1 Tax=Desulfovibrio inopinatus TaxID=102109 RepID=UPI0004137663|nr:HDOD domain-containing protein [Desulfovibrio inopinatus]
MDYDKEKIQCDKQRCPQINVTDIHCGMVLSHDVYSMKGRLLLKSGVTIDESHLRILNMWGVSSVSIHKESCLQFDMGTINPMQECIDHRFAVPNMSHEPYEELRRQAGIGLMHHVENGWTPQAFPKYVERTGNVERGPDINTVVTLGEDLYSLPDIYFEVEKALHDPTCTANRLADIISKDTGLTARLLRLANSASMGIGRNIDSLSRAVVLLGINEIGRLALGGALVRTFHGAFSEFLSFKAFWQHSLSCGVLARLLALHLQRKNIEMYFIAGMLHDVGRLVMVKVAAQRVRLAAQLAFQKAIPLYLAEHDVFGFDHCAVGNALLSRWNVPGSLVELVRFHHAPYEAPDVTVQDAAILSVANAISTALGYGFSGEYLFTGLAEGAWEALGIRPGVIASVVMQARRQLDDIYTSFLGPL